MVKAVPKLPHDFPLILLGVLFKLCPNQRPDVRRVRHQHRLRRISTFFTDKTLAYLLVNELVEALVHASPQDLLLCVLIEGVTLRLPFLCDPSEGLADGLQNLGQAGEKPATWRFVLAGTHQGVDDSLNGVHFLFWHKDYN